MMMTVPMAIMMLAGWVFHMQMSPPVNAVPGPTYKVAPILQDHNQTTSDRWPQPYNQSSVFTQPWPNLLGRFGPFCATNKKKCRNCVWNVCCPGKGQFCWLLHPHLKHMPWKFPLFLQFVVCFPLHFLPCYLFSTISSKLPNRTFTFLGIVRISTFTFLNPHLFDIAVNVHCWYSSCKSDYTGMPERAY